MRSSLPLVVASLAVSTLVACSGDTFTPGAAAAGGTGGAAGIAGTGAQAAGNAGATAGAGAGGGSQAGASGAAQAGTGGAATGGASGAAGTAAGDGGTNAGGQGGSSAGGGSGGGGDAGSNAGSAGSNAGSAGSNAGGGGQQGGSAGAGGNTGAGAGGAAGGTTSGCPVLYVSALAPTGPGKDGCSPDAPLRSIAKAFAAAKASSAISEIRICAGSYDESDLVLEASVAVRGGYDCKSWQVAPGPPDELSTIVGFTGGVGLTLPESLTAKTEIERIHFENRNTTNTRVTGILIAKNAVKLRQVRVTHAANAARAQGPLYGSAGLFVSDEASAEIRDSHFEGGPGSSSAGPGSVGVWLDGTTDTLVFENDDAIGGRGDTDSDVLPGSVGMIVRPRKNVTKLTGLPRVEGGPGYSSKPPPSSEPPFTSAGLVIRPRDDGDASATVVITNASIAAGRSRATDAKAPALQTGYTRGMEVHGPGLVVELVQSRVYGGDHAGELPAGTFIAATKTEALRVVFAKLNATSSLIHAGGLEGGTFYPRAVALEGQGASFRGRYVTMLPGKIAAAGETTEYNGGNALLGLIKADATQFELTDSLVVALSPKTTAFYGQFDACAKPFFVTLRRMRYVHPETFSSADGTNPSLFLGGTETCQGSSAMPLLSTTIGTAKLTIDNALHVGDAAGQPPADNTLAGCAESLLCAATIFPEAPMGGTRRQVLARENTPYTPPCTVGAGITTTAEVAPKTPDLMGKERSGTDKMLGALVPIACAQ